LNVLENINSIPVLQVDHLVEVIFCNHDFVLKESKAFFYVHLLLLLLLLCGENA